MSETLSARRAALDLLDVVLRRREPLDLARNRQGPAWAELSPRDRAFAFLLAATVLRRLGEIDHTLAHHLRRPLARAPWPVRHALRLGVAQLLYLGTPAHAAVDASVALAGETAGRRGLVNAVLRRVAEAGPDPEIDAARLDTPDWLWRSWRDAYGEATCRAITEAHLREPPLDLTPAGDVARWSAALGARVLPTGTLRLEGAGRIEELAGFGDGAWWVQDAAAALPVRLLGEVAGRPVYDLCAAPGGKTAQLAAAGARVTAVDRSETRLARLQRNLDRLGLVADVVVADVLQWRAEPAQAVLLDAPCTATGTIRRHPDVLRTRGPGDVARLAELQARLLTAAAELVAPGGLLVYCVCSLQPEEGEAQVATWLERDGRFRRVAITTAEVAGSGELLTPVGDLRTLPCHWAEQGGMDGFYACRLQRRA